MSRVTHPAAPPGDTARRPRSAKPAVFRAQQPKPASRPKRTRHARAVGSNSSALHRSRLPPRGALGSEVGGACVYHAVLTRHPLTQAPPASRTRARSRLRSASTRFRGAPLAPPPISVGEHSLGVWGAQHPQGIQPAVFRAQRLAAAPALVTYSAQYPATASAICSG